MEKQNSIKNKLFFLFIIIYIIAFIGVVYSAVTWSDESETTFRITSGKPICTLDDDESSSWQIIDENGDEYSWDATTDCYNENGVDPSANVKTECCPSHSPFCNHVTGECEENPGITCVNLSQAQCNNPNYFIYSKDQIESDPSNGEDYCGDLGYVDDEMTADSEQCTGTHRCMCSWNGTRCNAVIDYNICKILNGRECLSSTNTNAIENFLTNKCDLSSDESDNEGVGLCVLDGIDIEDYCNESDTMIKTWNYYCEDCNTALENSCVPVTKELRCDNSNILSFSTTSGLIIALVLIIIFYLIVIKQKKRYKNKKRNFR